MSAYSTIRIRRMTALGYILARIPGLSDDQLKYVMDALLSDRLYNCRIVDDSEDSDDNLL